jgi:hypothetical protein
MAGVYRFVCANGLVTGDSLFQPISVKHVGYKSEDAITASYRLIDDVPRIAQSIEEMQAVTLSDDEKRFFASSALIAKYGMPKDGETIDINPVTMLRPRRLDDQKNDLWSTFNVVQENMIKGGQRTVNASRTKRITTRGVSSISENAKLNAALWTLAESMKALKQVA